jgi:thiazole tautomerase (transcriptional regulator TenI)
MKPLSWQKRALQAGPLPPVPLHLPCPGLMLVTEPMEQERLTAIVRQAAEGGVNMVQLRDKTQTPSELTSTAAVLKRTLPETLILVNGCPTAARGARVGGVHLPEEGVQTKEARAAVGAYRLVGRSVHSVEAAQKAAGEGADYLIAGTIFASRSHPDLPPAGLEFLREVCAAVTIPVLAIGGITPENAPDCLRAGAAGIAVLSAILSAADPRAAAQRYRQSLETAEESTQDTKEYEEG